MTKVEKAKSSMRVKTNYVSTIISISLVLFMLGLLGLIVLNAKQISDHVKQNIGFSIYLQDEISPAELKSLQEKLLAKPYTNRIEYIDKEAAATMLKEDLGEDFVEFLGYNPLAGSIDVYLNADFAETESMNQISAELKKFKKVKEVSYQPDLISEVNDNIQKIGLVLLGFSVLLLIVVIALINNTIRLAIYSKRFLIKTMQLVGATSGFIRRPFVGRGVLNGIISGLIAILLLVGVLYWVSKNIPELMELQNINVYLILFSSVIVLGILISWISTSLAVRKFLRMQSGDLY
ncbi:MAG: cell division protein FtsX [Bacteroidetes bacterium]|nr:MAG: cell division protein FtsX [Bacteroidota bacterium]MBL1143398.1 FtsX-like permease family protein [Bacteroidota bacterium]MCB0801479.1 permease-like cell division protein FtsX [Flavobacteriales bacterium]NOG56202.1 cell division protein FtsX [Bacteroidota bacterium]